MIAWGLLLRGKSDVSSLSSRPGSAATCTACQCLLPYLIFFQDTTYGGENFCHVEKFQTESKTCTFFDGKMEKGEKWKKYMLVENFTFLWRKTEPKFLCVERKKDKNQVCLWPAALTPNLFSCLLGISNDRSTAWQECFHLLAALLLEEKQLWRPKRLESNFEYVFECASVLVLFLQI